MDEPPQRMCTTSDPSALPHRGKRLSNALPGSLQKKRQHPTPAPDDTTDDLPERLAAAYITSSDELATGTFTADELDLLDGVITGLSSADARLIDAAIRLSRPAVTTATIEMLAMHLRRAAVQQIRTRSRPPAPDNAVAAR